MRGRARARARRPRAQLALLYDAPRAATVAAERATKCWALDRTTFKKVIVDAGRDRARLYLAFLRNVPILGPLSDDERGVLADALRPTRFAEGEVIFEQGAAGDRFYIVEDGAVACTKLIDGVRTAVHEPLRRGDYFGELALLKGERRAATCTAIAPTTCCTIDCETFKRRGSVVLSMWGRAIPSHRARSPRAGFSGRSRRCCSRTARCTRSTATTQRVRRSRN